MAQNGPNMAQHCPKWAQHGPPMSSCHRPKSKILFRLNLDARSVPEALVNSFRLLTQLRTRLNPPEPQTPSKNISPQLFIPTRLFFPNSFNPYLIEQEIEVAESENCTPDAVFSQRKLPMGKTYTGSRAMTVTARSGGNGDGPPDPDPRKG